LSPVQRPYEVAECRSQHMKLETQSVGGEAAAGQPGPFDNAFALVDPMRDRAALIVEGDGALGPTR